MIFIGIEVKKSPLHQNKFHPIWTSFTLLN